MSYKVAPDDLWTGPAIMSSGPHVKSIYAYLTTKKHLHYSGINYIHPGTIAVETSWDIEKTEEALRELEMKGLIYVDRQCSVIYAPEVAKMNIRSPKLIPNIEKHLKTLYGSELIGIFVKDLKNLSVNLSDTLSLTLFGTVSNTLPNTLLDRVPDTLNDTCIHGISLITCFICKTKLESGNAEPPQDFKKPEGEAPDAGKTGGKQTTPFTFIQKWAMGKTLGRTKQTDDILDHFNKTASTQFHLTGKKSISSIQYWLAHGENPESMKRIATLKIGQWRTDPKMAPYVRPWSIFGENYEGYRNENHVNAWEVVKIIRDKCRSRVNEITDRLLKAEGLNKAVCEARVKKWLADVDIAFDNGDKEALEKLFCVNWAEYLKVGQDKKLDPLQAAGGDKR